MKIIGLALLCLSLSACIPEVSLFPKVGPLKETVLEGQGKEKILLIDLSGVISEEPSVEGGSGFGGGVVEPSLVARVKEELQKAEKDDSIRAVVLRINSPGGTVTASDIIYHEVMQFKKKTGKKVIASIGGIGASGGYYIAVAADQIVANPTAITGSIGVIMLHFNVQGLLEKIGVGTEAIKSGPHKDMASPFREISPEDRKILQDKINSMYARFLEVVTQGRKQVDPLQMKTIADGRIYTAEEAKKLNLIDQIGYLDAAIDLAKQEAGLTEAKVVLYRRPHRYANNIYSKTTLASDWMSADPRRLLREHAGFFYLWMQ
jgi:protease-4